jgi:hypothetical protein
MLLGNSSKLFTGNLPHEASLFDPGDVLLRRAYPTKRDQGRVLPLILELV